MDPITMALIAAGLVKGGVQMVQGIRDRREGKAMEAEAGDRPQFEIPESVQSMMNLYRQSAQSGMPGYDISKGDIQASTARTAGVAGQLADSPVAALTALGGAQDRELGALRDLNRRASEYQAMSQQNLARAYGQKAGYETEQWRQNELMPWEIQMNRAMQLQTSGAGNIMGGVDSMASGVAQGAGYEGTMNMYNQMYPNTGPTAQQEKGLGLNGGGYVPLPSAAELNRQGSGLGVNGSYVPPWQGGN